MKTAKEKALDYLEDKKVLPNNLFDKRRRVVDIDDAKQAIKIASEPAWIKCSERLPEIGLYILLYRTDPFRLSAIDIGFLVSDQYDRIIWSCKGIPTHWMPLPEAPTK